MKNSIFKLYDIRGRVPDELILEDMYDLGRAIAVYAVSIFPAVRVVVIGMDGRSHSEHIKKELCRAIQDSGFDVIFLGMCPTPLMYFALHTLSCDMGIMITASHNDAEYNGLKICMQKEPVWGKGIERIKQLYQEKTRILSTSKGNYQEYRIHDSYIDWLVNHFSHLIGMSLAIIMDCANGMAATILPDLIERFEWKHVDLLCDKIDGSFEHPADPVDSRNMTMLKEQVHKKNAACGIGFDGDADRMAAMTKEGIIIPGDVLLALFSEPVIAQHPGSKVIFDIKCSLVLPALLTEWGAQPIMTPSGHSIVKSEIKKHQAVLAGELSCHFFFNDRYFGYDDGIYAALRLIELLLMSHKSLDDLLVSVPHMYSTPELRLAIDEKNKLALLQEVGDYFSDLQDAEISQLDGIRITLSYGMVIVRFSNTEPVVCVRWESYTRDGFKFLSQEMEALLIKHCSNYSPWDIHKINERETCA